MARQEAMAVIPIFRMFDEAKAREFYLGFLGFAVDWEHRFEPDAPLYLQLSRNGACIHLSEHHGDCCPGAAARIETQDIDGLHTEITQKTYKYYRPAIEIMPWELREMTVQDPFGNKIIFFERMAPQ